MSSTIREIRKHYSSAYITLVVEKKSANLAECCPYIDEMIAAPFMSTPNEFTQIFIANLNIARDLLRQRLDIALAFAYSIAPNVPLLAYMSGAKMRITHNGGIWTPLVTNLVPPIAGKHHSIDAELSYAEYLIKQPIVNRALEAWVDQSDLDFAQSVLPSTTKLYAIGLGGSKARKHYPPKSYAKLINMLLRADEQLQFVVLGGSTDVDEAAIIMANVERNRMIDLVGKTTFRQTTAVLNSCDLYIGNDSVAMHLAAATETPVLAPFCFPSDLHLPHNVIDNWYPYGVPSVTVQPAHALPECRGSKNFYGCRADHPHCITQITPLDMFRAYNLLLERIAENNTEPLIVGSN